MASPARARGWQLVSRKPGGLGSRAPRALGGVSPPVPFHAQLPHGQWAGRRVAGSRPAHYDQAMTKLTGADSVPALTPGCPLTSRARSGHCEGGSLRVRPQASAPASCPWLWPHRTPSEALGRTGLPAAPTPQSTPCSPEEGARSPNSGPPTSYTTSSSTTTSQAAPTSGGSRRVPAQLL